MNAIQELRGSFHINSGVEVMNLVADHTNVKVDLAGAGPLGEKGKR